MMEWEMIRERLDGLLASGRHGELRGALRMINEVDIAQYMEEMDREKLLLIFRVLPKDISADVFSYMSTEQQQVLIESIGDHEIRTLIDDMFLDDAVDFLEELPAGVVRRVLRNTNAETRELINQYLQYPESSAGSIMTIEYMEFHAGDTVEKAMEKIRQEGLDKETIYTLYILDQGRHLMGTLALRKMILAEKDAVLSEMMDPNPISVCTTDDQEEVADLARRYDLMAIPVVDKENRMVGIITADDLMDVIEEENTEDFEKMAALTPSADEYLKTSPFRLALNRVPWLLIMAAIAIFTGMIIDSYEGLLKNASIVLTSCIPMLMNTGGNCGSQASTLIIRGIALGEIAFKDIFKAVWKELRVGAMVGVVLFGFTFLLVYFIYHATLDVALVVALALYCTVLIAKSLGCILPLCAKKVGFDPALMASPLITTIVDATSLTIYFAIATAILQIAPV